MALGLAAASQSRNATHRMNNGDHSFKPRKSSMTEGQNWEVALAEIVGYLDLTQAHSGTE
jgi:hypothetical protein